MTNLIDMTAAALTARYNELTGKSIKPTSYPKAKLIEMIEAATPEEDEAPLCGDYTNCPHCGIHLSNGYQVHDPADDMVLDTHEFLCLGCGEEFGKELEQMTDETFTLAELCAKLNIKPRAARIKLRAEIYDDKSYTKYVWANTPEMIEKITAIISPKKK